MKTLQNNFTTPDQSKRLLELGVPAGSVDCYIDPLIKDKKPWMYIRHDDSFWMEGEAIPCWSVGRLIEIIRICVTDFDVRQNLIETLIIPTADNVDVLVRLMTADEFKSDLDFSKLKEYETTDK